MSMHCIPDNTRKIGESSPPLNTPHRTGEDRTGHLLCASLSDDSGGEIDLSLRVGVVGGSLGSFDYCYTQTQTGRPREGERE